MTTDNLDADLLVALLAEPGPDLPALSEAEWSRLIALALRHTVAPLLYARLKERGVSLPAANAAQLRQIYLASATRNLHLFHELGKILRAMEAAHLPVIVLKGACLATTVYEHIAQRPMGDVDLLVPSDAIVQALAVMRTLGYTAAHPFDPGVEQTICHHMPPIFKPGGITVEIHWTIVNPRLPVHFDRNDLAQLWSRAWPITISGVSGLMFSPTDLLLHLCLHASVHHRFDGAGLRNYLDIAQVSRRYGEGIDWEQVTARARLWGIANGVHLALQLADEWTDFVYPPPVQAALHAAPLDDATGEWVRRKIFRGSSLAFRSDFARLAGKRRLADKLDVLRAVLFPPRAVMASMYPVPAHSWRILGYYPVRVWDLWLRYRGELGQIVRRDRQFLTAARQETRLREYLGWP